MANIQNWLDKIKNAIYGREMRQALHDSIEAVNDELDSTTSRVSTLETNLDREITNRQNADDILRRDLNAEIVNRQNADSTLQQAMDKEINDRQSADSSLQRCINAEIENRQDAESILQQSIDDEAHIRKVADDLLRADITGLQEIAHTHANKSVLDEITEERLTAWDSMGSDGTYIMELIGGLMTDVALLQAALGIVVYDGGLFEQEYNGPDLDGGDFDSESSPIFDCGDFEPITIPAGSIGSSVDGGQY